MAPKTLAGLVFVGVLAVTGCQASDEPGGSDASGDPGGSDASGPFQAPGERPGSSVTNANVAHTTEWTYGGYSGCFPGAPVPIVLTSVELLKPNGQVRIAATGIKVDDGRLSAGVMPGALPADYGPLRAITQVEANRMRCDGGDLVGQLAVVVSAPGHWEAQGMRLNYQAGGKDFVVDWRVRLVHCAPYDDKAEACLESAQ